MTISSIIENLLTALPAAATHPYAFIAYLSLVGGWLISIYLQGDLKAVLAKIEQLPEGERLNAIKLHYPNYDSESNLPPIHFLKRKRMYYLLVGYFATLISIIIIVVLVLTITTQRADAAIASSIEIGELVMGETVFQGDIDIYIFRSEPNRQYIFEGEASNETLRWRLISPENLVLFDQPMTRDPSVYTLEQGGEYTLEVGGEATGDYAFRITEVNQPEENSPSTEVAEGDNVASTVVITNTTEPESSPVAIEKECVPIDGINSLNLREGPGIEYEAVGYVTQSNGMTALERSEFSYWVYGISAGIQGWASTTFLNCNFNIDALPIRTSPLSSSATPTFLPTPLPPPPPTDLPSNPPSATPTTDNSNLQSTNTPTPTNTSTILPTNTPTNPPTYTPTPTQSSQGSVSYSFETGTQGWVPTTCGTLDTTSDVTYSGSSSLLVNSTLYLNENDNCYVEPFVDFGISPPEGAESGPYNLEGKRVTCFVYLPSPLGVDSDPPEVLARLFVKDVNFVNHFTSDFWVDSSKIEQWIPFSLLVGSDEGIKEPGFDAEKVQAISIRVELVNDSQHEYDGPIYIDNCSFELP